MAASARVIDRSISGVRGDDDGGARAPRSAAPGRSGRRGRGRALAIGQMTAARLRLVGTIGGMISILSASCCIDRSAGAVVLQPSMRTFGNALKSFPVKAAHEQVIIG